MAVHALSMVRAGAHTLTLRQKLETEIERLIGLLGALDGDCDLEDNSDDELSIGGAYDCDLELDNCDNEPSLGWITTDSGRIFTGGNSDLAVEFLPW